MGVKMNSRVATKKHDDDPERFPTESILKRLDSRVHCDSVGVESQNEWLPNLNPCQKLDKSGPESEKNCKLSSHNSHRSTDKTQICPNCHVYIRRSYFMLN